MVTGVRALAWTMLLVSSAPSSTRISTCGSEQHGILAEFFLGAARVGHDILLTMHRADKAPRVVGDFQRRRTLQR